MSNRIWLKGVFTHNIDPKGRTYFPAQFREVLGENAVVGLGMSGDHLVVYTKERYDEIASNIDRIYNEAEEGVEEIRDFFFNNSYDVELDKTGRFTVPPNLRGSLELNDEIVITGDGDKAKIWRKDMYQMRLTKSKSTNIQALASKYKIFIRKDDDDDI